MRSQVIIRRSQEFFKHSPGPRSALGLFPSPPPCHRNKHLFARSHLRARFLSTTPPIPPTPPPDEHSPFEIPEHVVEQPGEVEQLAGEVEQPIEEVEKPKTRKTRVSSLTTSAKESDPIGLPDDLDILWTRGALTSNAESLSALPPPEILEDALNSLLITLHPKAQHRATYPSTSGTRVEPTLGLYCPIEGGEYIVDATVQELARRTDSEVLVLDSAHLAAGEWGKFGKAASALQLPKNPLHFHFSPVQPSLHQMFRNSAMSEEEEDTDTGPLIPLTQLMMGLTASSPRTTQGRTIMATPTRRSSSPSKLEVFFDTIINMASKTNTPGTSTSSKPRPRLVYIRDFPTLAQSASVWYPPLLAAVKQRRKGPISRPHLAIANPMTIIFGMSPSLFPSASSEFSQRPEGLRNTLVNRSGSGPSLTPGLKPGRADWGEDEASEKAREKRLQERFKKWERGDSVLYNEFPGLDFNEDNSGGSGQKPEIIVINSNMPSLPDMLGGSGLPMIAHQDGYSDNKANFFRSTILVPTTRSITQERSTRIARRREINELTMRMGVGSIGGAVEAGSAAIVESSFQEDQATSASSSTDKPQMWEEWGNKLELWSNVRRIADRAIGTIMASPKVRNVVEKLSLEPTIVPWKTVQSAWETQRALGERRKSWMKVASPHDKLVQEELQTNVEDAISKTQAATDVLVEEIKSAGNLDSHEHSLLSCLVEPASLPTSFSQVHLPPHTIDSIRTIVSLPLLHPQAFQQGILKEHNMTGCLLFGPPGTGKTLAVRALAKEAGCRMLAVSSSNIMDMYVGEAEKLVKAVFSLARRLAPCVIFLDEMDSLFGARVSGRENAGSMVHRSVITEFMQEMDGLNSSKNEGVIVIGATNRPFDLDDAVLRRLPRRLLVDLPGVKEREAILKILLRDEGLAPDVDIADLAKKTESFSGSDLKHLCVSAALDAVKENINLPWLTTSLAPTSSSESISKSFEVTETNTGAIETSSTLTKTKDSPTEEKLSEGKAVIAPVPRVLHLRNFTKALKEITPSSSESLGSLAELRKWNDEFGEGKRDRKRQVWGKGNFGFVDHNNEDNGKSEVKVPLLPAAGTSKSSTHLDGDMR